MVNMMTETDDNLWCITKSHSKSKRNTKNNVNSKLITQNKNIKNNKKGILNDVTSKSSNNQQSDRQKSYNISSLNNSINAKPMNNQQQKGNNKMQSGFVQICFDFTKGRCNRKNCKYSHDIKEIIKYNSKEQGICFDFLRGECNRGPLCRFSHDLTKVIHQWMTELNGPQQKDPPNGICYDFVRGQCPRGKRCRFSHDLREIALATSRPSMPEIKNEEEENLKNQLGSDLISAVWLSSEDDVTVHTMPETQNEINNNCHKKCHNCVSECYSDSNDLKNENENLPIMTDFINTQQQMTCVNEDLIINIETDDYPIEEMKQDLVSLQLHSDAILKLKKRENELSNIRVRHLLGSDMCDLLQLPNLKQVIN